jgi:hypothetical protein
LKWVTDIEAIILTERAVAWSTILDNADRLGCRRMLLLAVALAERLLGAPPPTMLVEPLRKETGLMALVTEIQDRLLFPDDATMSFAERLRFDLAIRERARDRLSYRAARLLTPGKRDGAPRSAALLRIPLRLARLSQRYLLNPRRGREFIMGKPPSGSADPR